MTFSDLRLLEPIARAVAAKGYTDPSPIQAQAIPPIMEGSDVLGCAQTGTGKTAAFALPILHQLGQDQKRRRNPGQPHVLVLAPTRELATQIWESFRTYGEGLRLRCGVIFGGISQVPQVRNLRQGADVLVATPGRLLDLINQGYIDLSEVMTLVLDEADHMLDMGFINDINRILDEMPQERQTLLFSATMPAEIRKLADRILVDPVFIKTAPVASTVDLINQSVYMVEKRNKPELLHRLLTSDGVGRTLVFSRTKHGSDKLVKKMEQNGVRAAAIHGNKTQAARTRALDAFKAGKCNVLIATDIAARGIDVSEVTHVINYDLPNTPETYVHRIGRTARAGASGVAISLCDREEISDLRGIERLTGRDIDVREDESDLTFTAPPPRSKRNPGANPGKPGKKPGRKPGGRRQTAKRPAGAGAADDQPKRQGRGGAGGKPRRPGNKPNKGSGGPSSKAGKGSRRAPSGTSY